MAGLRAMLHDRFYYLLYTYGDWFVLLLAVLAVIGVVLLILFVRWLFGVGRTHRELSRLNEEVYSLRNELKQCDTPPGPPHTP